MSRYLCLPKNLGIDHVEILKVRIDERLVPRAVYCELEASLQLHQLIVIEALPLVIQVDLAFNRYAELKLIAAFEAYAVLDLHHVKGFPIENLRVELDEDLEPRMLDGSILRRPYRLWPHLHDVPSMFGRRVSTTEGQSSVASAAPKPVLGLRIVVVYRDLHRICALTRLTPLVRKEWLDLLLEHLTQLMCRVRRIDRWLHVIDVNVAHLLGKC